MNINLHSNEGAISLGAVRIFGSMPASKAVEIVKKRLELFGIDLDKDVVSSITDAASVMRSFGRMTSPVHVQCMSHGIHLAVCDVLYKNSDHGEPGNSPVRKQRRVIEEEEVDVSDDEDEDGLEEDGDVELHPNLAAIIRKVRETVKLFKYSPVKNDDHLQRYVVESTGKEYVLFLDCKTRWSSLLEMLKRFFHLRKEIECATICIDKVFEFSVEDMVVIEDLIKALDPIKAAIEALGAEDSDLIKSEKIIKFVLQKLLSLNTAISKRLHQAFIKRVEQRRNTGFIHLIEYLKNPSFIKNSNDHMGEKIQKKVILRFAMDMLGRLFPEVEAEEVLDNVASTPVASSSSFNANSASAAEELFLFLARDDFSEENNLVHSSASSRIVTQEMRLFEASKKVPASLEKLYQALKK